MRQTQGGTLIRRYLVESYKVKPDGASSQFVDQRQRKQIRVIE